MLRELLVIELFKLSTQSQSCRIQDCSTIPACPCMSLLVLVVAVSHEVSQTRLHGYTLCKGLKQNIISKICTEEGSMNDHCADMQCLYRGGQHE